MKRFLFPFVLWFTFSLTAQTLPPPPPAPTCEKLLGVTWADIRQCMNELVAGYDGSYHPAYARQFYGATFGYLPDGTTTPVISSAGPDYAAYADGDDGKGPILWLGSVTKPFTHASGLIALEQAGWNYDGPWTQIPGATGYLINADKYAASRALKRKISIRNVFTMTAGFTDTTVNAVNNSTFRAPGEPEFFGTDSKACRDSTSGTTDPTKQYYGEPGLNDECVFVPTTSSWRGARDVANRHVAQFLMGLPVQKQPLSQTATTVTFPYAYSNRSSFMTAWLAQTQSGQLPNHHVKQNIFTPLGMTNSFFIPYPAPGYDSDTNDPARIAELQPMANGLRGNLVTPPLGVRPCEDGTFWCHERPWRFPWPEGGMYSTPGDLFKFLAGLRDNTIPAFSATTRTRLLTDQLQHQHDGGNSRTAGFAYARNGVSGFVNGLTEGTVYHNGFPGFTMVHDPVRRVSWIFATQRMMRQKPYFQAKYEQFAEARTFNRMLTAMLENLRPDNLDLHFDAARAVHRGHFPLRYGSTTAGPGAEPTDAYVACANNATTCFYTREEEYNACGLETEDRWDDLSPNQRTMAIATAGCAWPGNGSRHDDDVDPLEPESSRNGPFRLYIGQSGDSATVASTAAPTAFTMSVWVRPRSTANNTILTRTVFHPAGDVPSWQIAIENGRIVANLWDTGGKRTVIGGTITPYNWYHVVAKATQNGALSLFVNGRPVGTSVSVGTFLAANAPSYSVGYYTVNAPGFDVAALNVYKQEHAAADIVRNCNGLKYRFPGMTCQ